MNVKIPPLPSDVWSLIIHIKLGLQYCLYNKKRKETYRIVSYRIIWYDMISYHIIYHIIYHILYIVSCRVVSSRVVSYIISYHIPYIMYHVTSHHIINNISCHIISCHISYHITCRIISYHISLILYTSYHIMSCYTISHSLGEKNAVSGLHKSTSIYFISVYVAILRA